MATYAARQARRRKEDDERTEAPPEPEPAAPDQETTLADRTLELQQQHGNAAVMRMLQGSPGAQALLQREAAAAEAPEKASADAFEQRMLHEDVAQILEYLKMQILDAPWESRIVGIIENWRDNDRLHGAQGTPLLDRGLLLLKMTSFPRRTARTLWIETYVNAYDTLWAELEDDRLERFKKAIEGSKQATEGPEGENENYAKDLAKQEGIGFFAAAMAMGKGAAGVGELIVRSGSFLLGHEVNPRWKKAMEESGTEAGYDLFGAEYLGPEDLVKHGYSQEDAERLAGEKLFWGLRASKIGTLGGDFIWKMVELAKGPIKEIKTALKLPALMFKIEDSFDEIGERVEKLQKEPGYTVSVALSDPDVRSKAFEIAGSLVDIALELAGGDSAEAETAEVATKAVTEGVRQLKWLKFVVETGGKITKINDILIGKDDDDEKRAKLVELLMETFGEAFEKFNEGYEAGLEGKPLKAE